jgi:hypothetical protein
MGAKGKPLALVREQRALQMWPNPPSLKLGAEQGAPAPKQEMVTGRRREEPVEKAAGGTAWGALGGRLAYGSQGAWGAPPPAHSMSLRVTARHLVAGPPCASGGGGNGSSDASVARGVQGRSGALCGQKSRREEDLKVLVTVRQRWREVAVEQGVEGTVWGALGGRLAYGSQGAWGAPPPAHSMSLRVTARHLVAGPLCASGGGGNGSSDASVAKGAQGGIAVLCGQKAQR